MGELAAVRSYYYLNDASARNGTVEILLPEGVQFVDGNLTYSGWIDEAPIVLEARVVGVASGEWDLTVQMQSEYGNVFSGEKATLTVVK